MSQMRLDLNVNVNVAFANPLDVFVGTFQEPTANVRVGKPEEQQLTGGPPMSFTARLTDSQQVQVVCPNVGADKRGNPAPIEGWRFETDDAAICTFDPDPRDATGFTGLLKATGPLTAATAVRAIGDGKIGAGTTDIIVNGLVEILAGDAVAAEVTVGTPEEQP